MVMEKEPLSKQEILLAIYLLLLGVCVFGAIWLKIRSLCF